MEKSLVKVQSISKELVYFGCFLLIKICLLVICFTSGITQVSGDYSQVVFPAIDHAQIP